MKKYIALAIASLTIFNTTSFAVSQSLENFTRVNTYKIGIYNDVWEGMWYSEGIINSYEYGLLTGVSSGKFGLSTDITIAQTLAIACRLHSVYNTGEENFDQSNSWYWYQVYVDYAIVNGIINSRQFSNYDKVATRSEFAGIIYYALREGAFNPINEINDIPDVDDEIFYSKAIFALYNAGILTGSDENGTFLPSSNISREEVATIISRVVNENSRVYSAK